MANETRKYFHNLDLIRFLAALWVVSAHFGHIGPGWGKTGYEQTTGWLDTFFRFGSLGVCIFFILSGFVIAHLANTTGPFKFGIGRVIRLMPGFWACMTLSTLAIFAIADETTIDIGQWAANLTLLPQLVGKPFVDGTYWTLVYEFVFYGWVFILLLAGVFHRYLLEICAVWLLTSNINILFLDSSILERVLITNYSGAFVSGIVLWHGMTHGYRMLHMALITVGMLCLAYGVQDVSNEEFLNIPFAPPDYWLALICAIASFLLVAVSIYMPQISKGLSMVTTLGAISYPLYLFHQEVGYLVLWHLRHLNTPGMSAIGVALLMTLCAYAIHVIFEKPLQSFFKKLTDQVAEKWCHASSARRSKLSTASGTAL